MYYYTLAQLVSLKSLHILQKIFLPLTPLLYFTSRELEANEKPREQMRSHNSLSFFFYPLFAIARDSLKTELRSVRIV